MRRHRLVAVSAGIVGALLLAATLFPVFAQAKMCSKCVSGLSDVKRIGLGLTMYAEDNGTRFPSRDAWIDASYPYVKSWRPFHCRNAPKNAWGYAFNGALDRAMRPENAALVPLVYDSLNPIKNASDLVTSLPMPGRHRGGNHIAYADGHVKAIRIGKGP